MDYDKLKKLVEDIYTLTWDYNNGNPEDAEDMKSIIDTINVRVSNFYKNNRVKIIWNEEEDTNMYMREEEYERFRDRVQDKPEEWIK